MRHLPGHTRQHCSLKAIRWRQLRPSFRMLIPSSSPAFAARFANRMAARTLQLRSNFDEFPAAYRTRGAASFFLPCFLFRHRYPLRIPFLLFICLSFDGRPQASSATRVWRRPNRAQPVVSPFGKSSPDGFRPYDRNAASGVGCARSPTLLPS